MGLKLYKAKRDFTQTDEPEGSKKRSASSLNFCIQKHAARRLHYDFRLEHDGVLLSWAVPKGPSLDPKDKRLAIQVEDHPLDYQYFEGIIPKGNYGAGTVEIWDHGTYTMPHTTDRKEIEKAMTEGLKKGHFAVVLHGEKLNGEFVFQKLRNDSDKVEWLLIKKSDAYSNKNPVMRSNKMPDRISPMLATLVEEPFDSEDWLFEVKWDGFRSLAFIENGQVELKSRNNLSFNQKFPSIVRSLEKSKESVILDGEIVVVDAKGRSDFQLMQNYQTGEGMLLYYVFDLLYKDGRDMRELPLIERKETLKKYLSRLDLPLIRFSDHIVKEGKRFFKEAEKEKLEGIIGKKMSSEYQSRRSRDWVKIKTSLRQEVVICGFTEPKGARKKFGALIAGIYDENNELRYAGHVGGGFNETLLQDIYEQLKPLIQKKSPFKKIPKVNMPVTWVKPKLMAEVSFAEWTKDNIMRQPIFQGLRGNCKTPGPGKNALLSHFAAPPPGPTQTSMSPAVGFGPLRSPDKLAQNHHFCQGLEFCNCLLRNDKDPKSIKKEKPEQVEEALSEGTKKIKDLTLTHLEKVYWPKEGYTKGDLISYYERIASFILPYLKDRPVMLHRYPEGINGPDFYQKDLKLNPPSGIKTFPLKQEGRIINYLIINDVRSLLYAVNLGSIDLHPFMATTSHLDRPDYCVIDLDPHGTSFDNVIEAALAVHELLDELKVVHCCKTSGGNGLHIVIPLHAKYDFDQSKQFAEIICHLVHEKLPQTTSIERSPEKRPRKVYLDFLQNRKNQSIAAPYSVRPREFAKVSTPLEWSEVNARLDVSKFNIKTVPRRLEKIGDIFKPVLGKGIDMKAILLMR
jgi:bifunctional non-homologous end joining protein LigD